MLQIAQEQTSETWTTRMPTEANISRYRGNPQASLTHLVHVYGLFLRKLFSLEGIPPVQFPSLISYTVLRLWKLSWIQLVLKHFYDHLSSFDLCKNSFINP